jgi:hypothetical protein
LPRCLFCATGRYLDAPPRVCARCGELSPALADTATRRCRCRATVQEGMRPRRWRCVEPQYSSQQIKLCLSAAIIRGKVPCALSVCAAGCGCTGDGFVDADAPGGEQCIAVEIASVTSYVRLIAARCCRVASDRRSRYHDRTDAVPTGCIPRHVDARRAARLRRRMTKQKDSGRLFRVERLFLVRTGLARGLDRLFSLWQPEMEAPVARPATNGRQP